MSCHRYRIAISALVDGEAAVVSEAAVDRHVQGCAACARFRDESLALRRLARFDTAPHVPDVRARVFGVIADERRAARPSAVRLGLAAIAIVQLVASLPALVLGEDAGLPAHTARHLGSFGAALAIGFLFAAWKPERVAGILPVAAALVLFLVGSSAVDVAVGRTAVVGELGHGTEVAGVLLLWLMAGAPGARHLPGGARLRGRVIGTA